MTAATRPRTQSARTNRTNQSTQPHHRRTAMSENSELTAALDNLRLDKEHDKVSESTLEPEETTPAPEKKMIPDQQVILEEKPQVQEMGQGDCLGKAFDDPEVAKKTETCQAEEPKKPEAEITSEPKKSPETSEKDEAELEKVAETVEEVKEIQAKEDQIQTKAAEETEVAQDQKTEGSQEVATAATPVSPLPTELEAKRHPLESTWTLWFMDGDKRKQHEQKWGSNLIPIYTIKDVEDWWLLYSYILLPSKLRVKNDYMLFRGEIEPKWEDPSNKNGGKWQLVLPNKYRVDKLDGMWLTTILSMIGEHYGDLGSFVNGAYLQRRQKEDRISLWTSSAEEKDREGTETIGKILKDTLRLSAKSELHYLKHEDPNANSNSKNGQPNQSWHRRNQEANRLYKV